MRDPEVRKLTEKLLKEKLTEEELQYWHKRLNEIQERFDAGQKLAQELGKLVNVMNSQDELRGFITGMKCEHRTLQQSAFGLFLAWTYAIADYQSNDYDLRNEAMVKAAKKIKEALGEYGKDLPFI
jgi:hypothetical protein